MISEPVLKDLQGAKKTHKLAGIALETRQGVILGAAFVVYSLVCYYLADLLGLNPGTAAIAFSWIVPLAAAFAFIKVDGRHLDFWLTRKYISATRPDVLYHTQPEVANPTHSLRDSVQRAIPAEEFHYEMLRCKDGVYLMAFEVEPVGLSLVGETERGRAFRAAVEFYNRLDFPIVEIVRGKEGSTARYTRRLKKTISASIAPDERLLRRFAERFTSYLEEVVPTYNIYERRCYIILPYNPSEEGEAIRADASLWAELRKLLGFRATRPSARDARQRQEEANAARRILWSRAQIVHDGATRMGCRIRLLKKTRLVSFLKEQHTGWNPDYGEPKMYSPATLEHAGYDMLADEERQKLAKIADEVRDEGSIAFAAGELSIAERIAPDTVRIHPDYCRVEGRLHATLYVSEWADEVYFGMLEALTHIEGRVKLVKYITPQPKDKALKILGARLASLRAAERTADDGDVRSSQQREISRFTNEVAMKELVSDRQHYLELSCFIHVEANSEEELQGLVDEVRTALAGYRSEAKLCREEAWESFLTCQPFGREYTAKRYTRRGILSNPLACLFSFGTTQIDHENGVMLGIDTASGGPVTLDSRELVNPHSVTIGQSGAGKSFVVKCRSTRERMLGRRIVIVDPESNSRYARVAKEIGGAFALIAPGSPHKINPFDLHDDYLNISLLEDIDPGEAEADEKAEIAYRRARSAALMGKLQEITRIVSLKLSSDAGGEGLTGAQAGYVERAASEAYAQKGITADPATHRREPPTFKDFYRILAGYAEESSDVTELHEKLYSWHSGALSTLFDSQTNVDLSNKYLVFQISKVKGRQKPPVMNAVLEFMNGVLSNPNEAAECYVDEAWSILKDPMAAEFAETMWRSARARNCGMHAISQMPLEFFGSEQGQVILSLSATHLIFRHEQRQSAQATAAYYDLSEEETDGLLSLQPGEGYLVIGQRRVPLSVIASERETELFNTNPTNVSESAETAPLSHEAPYTDASQPAASQDGDSWHPYEDTSSASSEEFVEDGSGFVWEGAEARILAFVGDNGARLAARVSRAFAQYAEPAAYVLAVDATGDGRLYADLAYGGDAAPPDPYLQLDAPDLDALGAHVSGARSESGEPVEALRVVPTVLDPESPADILVDAAKSIFDPVVVACQPDDFSSYAADWILDADVVVSSSSVSVEAVLRAAESAESMRGEARGTLLCVEGTSDSEIPADTVTGGRSLFTLTGPGGRRDWHALLAELSDPAPVRDADEEVSGNGFSQQTHTAEVGL